jgi:hypothetical protein
MVLVVDRRRMTAEATVETKTIEQLARGYVAFLSRCLCLPIQPRLLPRLNDPRLPLFPGTKALPSVGVQSLHSCRKIVSQTMSTVPIPTGRLNLESIPPPSAPQYF